MKQLVDEAAERTIGIHGVCIGAAANDTTAVDRLCTKPVLGYGRCHAAQNGEEMDVAIEECIDALMPRPWNSTGNRVVFVIDCRRNTLRMELVKAALVNLIERTTAR